MIASLKVKPKRSKPRPEIKDDIQNPSEKYKNSSIELCIDVVYINGVAFMVFIYRQVKYISIINTKSNDEEEFSKVLSKSFKSIIQLD